MPLRIEHFEERSMGSSTDAQALAIVEGSCQGLPGSHFGASQHANTVTASILAVLSLSGRFMLE